MKNNIPSIPRHHYGVRSSQLNLKPDKNAPRVYYADTYHEAVSFITTFKTWGSIRAYNGGIEWRIEI